MSETNKEHVNSAMPEDTTTLHSDKTALDFLKSCLAFQHSMALREQEHTIVDLRGPRNYYPPGISPDDSYVAQSNILGSHELFEMRETNKEHVNSAMPEDTTKEHVDSARPEDTTTLHFDKTALDFLKSCLAFQHSMALREQEHTIVDLRGPRNYYPPGISPDDSYVAQSNILGSHELFDRK